MKHPVITGTLKFMVAFAILYWLWQTDRFDFSVVYDVLHPVYFPVLLACTVASIIFFVMRFHLILNTNGIQRGFLYTWKITMMGLFFNFTLPGGTSGDLVKIYYLAKIPEEPKRKIVGMVILDRLVGLFGMMLMAFVALLVRPGALVAQGDLLALFFLLGIGLLILGCFLGLCVYCSEKEDFSHPLLDRLLKHPFIAKTFDTALHLADLGLFLRALVLTVSTQICAVLVLYVSALAIGFQNLDIVAFFIVAPLGLITMAVPISPAGVGVGQVAFFALFKIYTGIDSDLGPAVVTVYQVLLFLTASTGLYYYLRWKPEPSVDPVST